MAAAGGTRSGAVDGDIVAALPGYEVAGELGRGAMGVVLGGRHRKLGRAVAIKQLPPAIAQDAAARERFGNEARLLASLTHPHIVPVFDYVEQEGLCLLVMEALPGGTVWDRFTTEGLTPITTCAVAVATCAGLQHAHDHQVLHRDIKPENLLFGEDNTLKVTDFGIAEALGGDQTLATTDGGVVGTPAYMAPEQAEGGQLGPTADVYATGTLLFEMLSGRLPFDADDPVALLERRLTTDPLALHDVAPDLPADLCAVVMQALERDPSRRQPTARALGGDVVAAARAAWGEDWLERSTVNVLTPLAPTARPAAAPADSAVATPAAPPTGDPADRGRATTVSGGVTAAEPAPNVETNVRPTIANARVRVEGVRIDELDRDDLVPVTDLLTPPPVPRLGLAALAVTVVALVLVALLGLGSRPLVEADLAGAGARLAGVNLARGEDVPVDLAEPVRLVIDTAAAQEQQITHAQLELSAVGVPLGGSGRRPFLAGEGFLATQLEVGNLRYVAAGDLTGTVTFYAEREPVLVDEVVVQPETAPWLTVVAVAAVLVGIGVIVYALSVTGPLRAGRRRRSSWIALPVVGAVGGLDLVLLAWSLGIAPEPTAATLVAGVVLGALAGGIAAPVLFRLGRRRRLDQARA